MAIVKMKKFTLLGFESQRAKLLEKLQGFSEVEFINLQDENLIENNENLQGLSRDRADSDYAGCDDKLSKAKFALEFLSNYVPQKSGLKAMKEGKRELSLNELESKVNSVNWEAICEKVKEKEEEISAIDSKITKLEGIIDTMMAWESLDVSFEELNSIKLPHFLGTVPKQYEAILSTEFTDCYFEQISANNQDVNFLIICDNDMKEDVTERLRGFGFSQFKTDLTDVPLKIVHDSRDEIEKLKSKKFFVCEELAGFEEDYRILELVNEYYGNLSLRKSAVENFLKTENVMVIQGWVPEEEMEKLNGIINDILGDDCYVKYEDVKEDEMDVVPTKLKNNSLNSAFEDITQMFAVPRYDDIDPTPFVTPFYLLFFGMMIADIGYGLLMLISTLVALKKFKFEESTKNFVKFFHFLSYPSIGFGLIYGSFFGDVLEKFVGITLPRMFNTSTDIMAILKLSVVFGVIQIFFGLAIKAAVLIKAGKPKDAFYDVGAWIITLISLALVLGAGALGISDTIKKIAIGFMIFGMAVIVLTGGRAEKSTGARLGQGAYSLYGITSYVGDLVSYTRLMALGLSGGSLAGAFNMICHDMLLPTGVVGIIFIPVIIIFGHIFNLALSLLGAYVHTCRLQYVEYFGKFYEGGGRAFAPFKTQNKFINVKRD